MTKERYIVMGCDDTAILTTVLNSLKETDFSSKSIIAAIRVNDLISIINSLNPDLVILCFPDNQRILNEVNALVKNQNIPVLCLTRPAENEMLLWGRNSIVFTYPLAHIGNEDFLNARINSIFLLRNSQQGPPTRSAAGGTEGRASRVNNAGNLSRYVLELDQKIEVLAKVKERIADIYPKVDNPVRAELNSIVNSIKMSANDTKLWDDFKLFFEQTDPNFLFLLAQKYPSLTTIDLKYCCYLKLNMTNDDIRNLLGINQESVRTHKYRLKKKMSLPRQQDLRTYLKSVG